MTKEESQIEPKPQYDIIEISSDEDENNLKEIKHEKIEIKSELEIEENSNKEKDHDFDYDQQNEN